MALAIRFHSSEASVMSIPTEQDTSSLSLFRQTTAVNYTRFCALGIRIHVDIVHNGSRIRKNFFVDVIDGFQAYKS